MTVQLQVPFTMIVAGTTSSGKSSWIRKLMKQRAEMFSQPVNRVYYHYAVWQPAFADASDEAIEYHEGLPNVDELEPHSLLVLDDLMTQLAKDKSMMDLFCVKSHHNNISVIMVTQHFYFDSPIMRVVSSNAHYIGLFRSPRMGAVVEQLSRQMWPGRKGYLADAYQKATKDKLYSYLFLNLHPSADAKLAVTSNVLPSPGEYTRVFL
jgi:hypothetical protein